MPSACLAAPESGLTPDLSHLVHVTSFLPSQSGQDTNFEIIFLPRHFLQRRKPFLQRLGHLILPRLQ